MNNGWVGIYSERANRTIVIDNKINDSRTGISLIRQFNITVRGNIIFNNTRGIMGNNSNECIFSGNNIFSNNRAAVDWPDIERGIGIHLEESHRNTFLYNHIYNNDHYGIIIEDSKSNIITSNKVSNSNISSIYVLRGGSNIISSNNIRYNTQIGICIDTSIGNIIYQNEISDNYIGAFLDVSYSNIISNNYFENNSGYGIRLSEWGDNKILDNYFHNNVMGDISDISNNHNSLDGIPVFMTILFTIIFIEAITIILCYRKIIKLRVIADNKKGTLKVNTKPRKKHLTYW
jgi:parallel beta-helix repeat protein